MTTDKTDLKVGDKVKAVFKGGSWEIKGELLEWHPPWANIKQGAGEYGGNIERIEKMP